MAWYRWKVLIPTESGQAVEIDIASENPKFEAPHAIEEAWDKAHTAGWRPKADKTKCSARRSENN